MDSLVLSSIIFASVAIPAIAAGHRNPRRGISAALLLLLAFNAVYVAYLTLVHVVLYVPRRW